MLLYVRLMSSLRRIEASRANGARSKGPVTPEGKKRSAMNAMRHGLLSDVVALEGEGEENFQLLLEQHVERLQPADGVEYALVEEMAAAYSRLHRQKSPIPPTIRGAKSTPAFRCAAPDLYIR